MNHDVAHCFDYKKGVCPKSCFRAEVTQDIEDSKLFDQASSFASFKGSRECPMTCPQMSVERAIAILTPDAVHYTPQEYEEALSLARQIMKDWSSWR